MKHLFQIILILVLAACPVTLCFGKDDAVSAARTAVLDSVAARNIQTTFPADAISEKKSEKSNHGINISASGIRYVLYAALIVFILVLFLTLYNNVKMGKNITLKAARPDEVDAGEERMNQARDDARGQADDGAYLEALHTLLFRSVEELRNRLGISLSRSLTSREILDQTHLGAEAKAAFRTIVEEVEVTYFGGREPTREAYERCHDSFLVLTRALAEGDAR